VSDKTQATRTPKSAYEGAYGAAPYDRDALYAEVMLRAIHVEMPDVAYYTREDLMQLSCFAMVSTITRYRYVCAAVTHAVTRNWMVPVSRTQLVLTGRKRAFLNSNLQLTEYLPAIKRRMPDGDFSGTQLVDTWRNDQHLTYNAKRTIIREALKYMVRYNIIDRIDFDTYRRKDSV
jgi:hypothetical protein